MTLHRYAIRIGGLSILVESQVGPFDRPLASNYGPYLVAADGIGTPDLTLAIEPLTSQLPAETRPGHEAGRVWSDGRTVRVFAPATDAATLFLFHVRPYLTMSIARLLWVRFGIVTLHASAAQERDGRAVLFTGMRCP